MHTAREIENFVFAINNIFRFTFQEVLSKIGPRMQIVSSLNPLNAELNPICHLLVLLGDLTFMGTCIVSIFQYTCVSDKMQRYTVYLYLETALNISAGTSARHQERIQLYLQHLVFVTTLLLSAAIVEELEPVSVCCRWRKPPTAH
jgi:hypothetical protein